jgi:hypothetical protein
MARTKENRRVIRVPLDEPLKVVIGSIGNTVKYDLETKNISINGFFLNFDKPGRFPFTGASILEVWLELSTGQQIFFNGKLARKVMPDDPRVSETGPGIAIKIVQIDKKNEDILRNFIEHNISKSQTKDGSAA